MQISKEINGRFYRFYSVDYKHNRYYLPSVSTLANVFSPKYALFKWRERVGTDEADRITKTAANRGTKLHLYCLSGDDKHISFNDSQYAENYDINVRDKINVISAEEEVFYINNGYGAAGRYDLVCQYSQNLYIADYKFTNKLKTISHISNYALQLAGYSLCIEFSKNQSIENALLINLSETEYRVFNIKLNDYKKLFIDISKIYEQYLRETDNNVKYKMFDWKSVTGLAKDNITIIEDF